MNSDVLIIGGGVIGLCIARELLQNGVRNIVIVEKSRPGREASWAAAGILAPQAETDRIDDFYRLCAASRDVYPGFATELNAETGIDIELDRTGTLYLAFNEHDVAELRRRFEWQRSAGLEVEHLTGDECRSLEPAISERVREGLFFRNDWQVENRKLLAALIEFARRNDIEISGNTAIHRLFVDGRKAIGAEAENGKTFSAGRVVLATGAWTSLIKIGEAHVPVEVKPIRGQMIRFGPTERRFKHVIYSPRGYLVPRADGRILAGATVEDVGFDTATSDRGISGLHEAATEIAPGLASIEINEQWAGLRPFAADGLPVIGRLAFAENLIVATAHYRNGILLAPITAKLVAEEIAENNSSEVLSPFSPQRFRTAGSGM